MVVYIVTTVGCSQCIFDLCHYLYHPVDGSFWMVYLYKNILYIWVFPGRGYWLFLNHSRWYGMWWLVVVGQSCLMVDTFVDKLKKLKLLYLMHVLLLFAIVVIVSIYVRSLYVCMFTTYVYLSVFIMIKYEMCYIWPFLLCCSSHGKC